MDIAKLTTDRFEYIKKGPNQGLIPVKSLTMFQVPNPYVRPQFASTVTGLVDLRNGKIYIGIASCTPEDVAAGVYSAAQGKTKSYGRALAALVADDFEDFVIQDLTLGQFMTYLQNTGRLASKLLAHIREYGRGGDPTPVVSRRRLVAPTPEPTSIAAVMEALDE